MFSVYILQSESTGTYYVGQTQDVHKRLLRHNAGEVRRHVRHVHGH
ncbi:MAG: GIY-YIG nuclease family protein [Candidatus Kapaibacterium sp.]